MGNAGYCCGSGSPIPQGWGALEPGGAVWEVIVGRVWNCQAPGTFLSPAGPRLGRLPSSHIPEPPVLSSLLPFPSSALPLPEQQRG